MPKERTGSIVERDGRIYVRVSYTDAAGKKRELMRRAADRTDARKIIKQLLGTLDQSGARGIDGERMTFAELADIFRERRLIPARYVGEGDAAKKAAGMRNWKSPRFFLRPLTEHFGRKRLRDITPADIEAFKLLRLDTPTKAGTPRTVAAVNRELQLMRTALRYAVRQGWLTRSPFDSSANGERLIDVSAENRRERVLSLEEEARLLAAIDAEPLRAHLRPLIVAAVDTAARRNELLTLAWRDVDLPRGVITVRAINAKTGRARTLPITPRLADELERLRPADARPGDLVFGGLKNVKRSFGTACRVAGIGDLHFHDLRHTAITRMVRAGVNPGEAMKVSGHSELATFLRYLNPEGDALRAVADALAALHRQPAPDAPPETGVGDWETEAATGDYIM
jgi:integrase